MCFIDHLDENLLISASYQCKKHHNGFIWFLWHFAHSLESRRILMVCLCMCLCMCEAIRHVNRKVMKSTRMCACLRWPSLDSFEKLVCVELGNYELLLTAESFRLCWETNIFISVHPNVSPFTQKSCLEQSLIHQTGRMEIPSLSVNLWQRKQRGEKSVEKRLLRVGKLSCEDLRVTFPSRSADNIRGEVKLTQDLSSLTFLCRISARDFKADTSACREEW